MIAGRAAAAIAGVLVALAVSAAASAVTVRTGPVDPLGARTAHLRPTATSGGVALLAAVALGLLVYVLGGGETGDLSAVGLALASSAAAGLLGAFDDMIDLDAKAKLLVGVLIACAFARLAGPLVRLPLGAGPGLALWPAVGVAGAGLWIVTASNAVNFMDGANGLAPGAMAIAFAALAVAALAHGAPGVGVAAACAAAACAGLLPFNLKGVLFQGDVGALFAAFFFAALCLVAAGPMARGPVGLYFGPTALAPFLADVLLTLLDRARRRRPLLQAHSDHLYQRWLRATGRSHGALARRGGMIMALFGAAAAAASFGNEATQTATLVLAVVVCVAGWLAIGRLAPAR